MFKAFLYGLTLLFIGLKLTHYIDWSWWLVFLPLYGPFLAGLVVCLLLNRFPDPTRERPKR